ncbi:kinase-like domain-containing protein [Dissophora ornata]|nr:kinase-like domain-containing protein [Dissophora ornata]
MNLHNNTNQPNSSYDSSGTTISVSSAPRTLDPSDTTGQYDQSQRPTSASRGTFVEGSPITLPPIIVENVGPRVVSTSHTMLLSPIYEPRSLPSPSLSPSSSSMPVPSISSFGTPMPKVNDGPSDTRLLRGQIDEKTPFLLRLECNKTNLLGHGRHAEVYKALVHPLSAPMRQYLLSRKTTKSMSCKDLFQQGSEAVEDDTFVCAAKCLFSDTDSQSVGLAEAAILRRLHSGQAHHLGRQYLVDYFGLYDQATKQAISTVETTQHDLATGGQLPSGEWALLLEYCQHGSIWDWIRQHPEQVGFRQWLKWALQLLQAVDCIHDAGLVHHDIKPHNILLDSSLDAKLSDFGASLFLGADPVDQNGVQTGSKFASHFKLEEGRGRGTPPYAAPEMFASASTGARYGQSIDMYSLGVSLYVIGLTAQEPFHKLKSVMEMVVWIKKGGFWLWEDQGWVHDRGPVPKVTRSSRLSSSSAILAQALSQGQDSNGLPRAPRSSSVSSNAPALNLPPINTQLSSFDRTALSPSSAYSSNSPCNQFLPGYSPERSSRLSLPSTPVSPLPLPSPLLRSQTPRSTRKEEQRRSGEIVMRFLNGEVVPPEVISLLKDMCHTDPERRPNAKAVLERLQIMKEQLDRDMEANEQLDVVMEMAQQ